ncbi:MAG: phosphate/phosphite/phosphonate ABC transporter substrate-binding protein [Nitrospinae bacterium]|nr:phosphate/phosphite/phosphonate ABC transporter substrate-binding protein [Nitrospinota bacterium]
MRGSLGCVLWGLLTVIFITGCSAGAPEDYRPAFTSQPPGGVKQLIFGVHPLHNPNKLFEVYGPIVDYLNENLKDVSLRLEASRNYDEFDKKLYARHFDLALPNPYQTIKAMKHGYHVYGKMGDDENFRGIILVRKDGVIREVADLKGKTVSFPAATALAATMMPQYYLHTHGLDINRDITVAYVGSQESSIMNVYIGKAAAGATWPVPWIKFIKERPDIAEKLMVKWQTETLPNNSLVARDDTPAEVVERVGALLFTLQDSDRGRRMLEQIPISRFEKATDATYEPVRQYIRKFSKNVRPVEE